MLHTEKWLAQPRVPPQYTNFILWVLSHQRRAGSVVGVCGGRGEPCLHASRPGTAARCDTKQMPPKVALLVSTKRKASRCIKSGREREREHRCMHKQKHTHTHSSINTPWVVAWKQVHAPIIHRVNKPKGLSAINLGVDVEGVVVVEASVDVWGACPKESAVPWRWRLCRIKLLSALPRPPVVAALFGQSAPAQSRQRRKPLLQALQHRVAQVAGKVHVVVAVARTTWLICLLERAQEC